MRRTGTAQPVSGYISPGGEAGVLPPAGGAKAARLRCAAPPTVLHAHRRCASRLRAREGLGSREGVSQETRFETASFREATGSSRVESALHRIHGVLSIVSESGGRSRGRPPLRVCATVPNLVFLVRCASRHNDRWCPVCGACRCRSRDGGRTTWTASATPECPMHGNGEHGRRIVLRRGTAPWSGYSPHDQGAAPSVTGWGDV